MNSDASALVVSGYDADKCKATTTIILRGGMNALREASRIVHAGRAGAQSAYFVEKGILFPLIDILRDSRPQREKPS